MSFAESPETTPSDLAEIAPTVLVATPRMLERIRGETELRIQRAGRFKRVAYGWSMRRIQRGSSVGAFLGRLLVGRFVVDKVGLGELRYGGIGGSNVPPGLISWFWALKVPMRVQYGQVESGGIVTSQRGSGDAGTAGAPIGAELAVRVGDDGELWVRSPGLLAGYLGETQPPVEDGWFRTGDLARIDEQGRVVPVARIANILVTAAGAEVVAAEVESELKLSPYITSALVLAAARPFVSALLELDLEAVSDWARRHGVAVSTYASLVESEGVIELIDREVQRANATQPAEQQVQAFRLLPRLLDAELTPTGKIRREQVEQEFSLLIDEIYAEGSPASAPSG